MKAIGLNRFGSAENLEFFDLPEPLPQEDELLIEIHSAGINPVDWKIREGFLKERMPYQLPIILGWDFSGTIQKTGKNTTRFKVGDEVFGYARKEKIQDGTYAEKICLAEKQLSYKPKNLSWEEAAAVPLAALTAYQVLFEKIKIQNNETILIHAGAGGVGGFAIQMAQINGAEVLTTGSEKNRDYLLSLGAKKVIDYNHQDFVEEIQKNYPEGIDAVFDTVGGEVQKKSLKTLKQSGRMTSILAIEPEVEKSGFQIDYVFVRAEPAHLDQIAKWIEERKIQINLHQVVPFSLEEIKKAHIETEKGHTCGKRIIRIQ